MKRLITVAVAAVLALSTAAPAGATTKNWLGTDCATATSRSCVEEPPTVDDLLRARAITVHDARGKAITILTRAQLNRVLVPHAKKCPSRGDFMGCTYRDSIMGRTVVMPSGMAIAVTFLR